MDNKTKEGTATAFIYAASLPEAHLDKAAGIYEIKDGAVIFQAASRPDTAQVISLPAKTTPKTPSLPGPQ